MADAGYRKVIDLGIGTSFDVKQYSGWENFTIDNFIVESVDGSLTAAGANTNSYGFHIDGSATTTLFKNYSNGIFTAYNTFDLSGRAYYQPSATTVCRMQATENLDVHAYLILSTDTP